MALAVNQTTFKQEVLSSSVPVLVNFWAPWCGTCRLVEPMLSKLQNQWNGEVRWVNVNADENLKLANAYRLQTLPTVILFNQGRILHRLEQFHSKAELQIATEELQTALESVFGQLTYSASA